MLSLAPKRFDGCVPEPGALAAEGRTPKPAGRGGFRNKAFYRVGSYTAEAIGKALGRETLVRTICEGPLLLCAHT